MASLTGQTVSSTYDGLLKTDDNDILGAAPKEITDGLGNGSGMTLSTTGDVSIAGDLTVDGAILDSNGVPGASGQILSSTVTGTDWVSLSEISGVDGTGTANYIAKWTDGDTIGNSVIYDNGTNVGIGTTSPLDNLHIASGTATVRLEDNVTSPNNFGSVRYIAGRLLLESDRADVIGNSTIELRVDNEEKMRIDNAGNVGIGTSSPSAKLQVNGGGVIASISDWNTNSNTVFHLANPAVRLGIGYNNSDNPIIQGFSSINATKSIGLQVYGGAIGIGTSSPSAKLHISSPSFDQLLLQRTGAANAGVNFKMINSDGEIAEINNTSENAIQFQTGGSERMRIDSAGNVGIGTTNPTQKLTVQGNVYAFGGFEGYRLDGGVGLEVNGGDLGSGSYIAKFKDYSNNSKVVIDGTGSVGIGTTSPAEKLTINGKIKVIDNNYDAYFLSKTRSDNSQRVGFQSHVAGALSIHSNNSERIRIDGNGKVGIGTSSPTTKFEVNQGGDSNGITLSNSARGAGRIEWELSGVTNGGHKFIHNNGTDENVMWYSTRAVHSFYTNNAEKMRLEADGDLHVDGDVIAYSTTISDQRLKDDVQTIDNALDKVSNLRGVSYTWNNGNRKGQKDLGLIAQEVEQVLPELVREKEMPMIDGGTYKTVDYEKIVGVLIEAVKELKAEIEILKSK